MEHSLPLWVVEMIGILLLAFILIVLLDIMKTLDRIGDHLKEANDTNPNVKPERYLGQDDIRP